MINLHSIYEIGDWRHGKLFQTANSTANSDNTYTTDYKEAAEVYTAAETTLQQNHIEHVESQALLDKAWAAAQIALQIGLGQLAINQQEDRIRDAVDEMADCCDAFPAPYTPEDVFGVKPSVAQWNDVGYNPVEFVPPDICEEALCSVECNLENAEEIEQLASKMDEISCTQFTDRMKCLTPCWNDLVELQAKDIYNRLSGKIDIDDAFNVVNDRATFMAAIGTVGCNIKLMGADLGIESRSLKESGHRLLAGWIQTLRNIYPLESVYEKSDSRITAMQKAEYNYRNAVTTNQNARNNEDNRYKSAFDNAQIQREIDQFEYDISAAPTPWKKAMAETKLECCKIRASALAQIAGLDRSGGLVQGLQDNLGGLISAFRGINFSSMFQSTTSSLGAPTTQVSTPTTGTYVSTSPSAKGNPVSSDSSAAFAWMGDQGRSAYNTNRRGFYGR